MSIGESHVQLEAGRVADGVPLGLFCRVETATFGPRRVDARTWLFLPRSRISRVYPYGATFDPARCSGDTCGRYEIDNGNLIVRWDGGGAMVWTYGASAEGVTLDGALYRPARPVTLGTLAGRWADESSGNVYRFDTDASFSFGVGQGGLIGKYELEQFALTLTFADGHVRRRTIFAANHNEPVGMISIEGEVYVRSLE